MFCYCPPEILANHRCFIPEYSNKLQFLRHDEFYAHAVVKTWVCFELVNRVLVNAFKEKCVYTFVNYRTRTYQIRYASSFLGIKKNTTAVPVYFRTKTLKTTSSRLQLSCCYILVSTAIGQCCGTES